MPYGHDQSAQGQIIDQKMVIKMNTKKIWDDEYGIHKNIKVIISKNEDISWYVEGYCLVALKVFFILAIVSLRTTSKAKNCHPLIWDEDREFKHHDG